MPQSRTFRAILICAAFATSVNNAHATTMAPDPKFGEGEPIHPARAAGDPIAIAKGANGRLVVASTQRIDRKEARDSTTVCISMLDRKGRSVREFGQGGTVKYRSRGLVSGLQIAVGAQSSVTIAQIVSRFEGYGEAFGQLQLLRFTNHGRPDLKIGSDGRKLLLDTRRVIDSNLDYNALSLGVDKKNNAYVLANETSTNRKVFSVGAEGDLRRAFMKRSQKAFPSFPRDDWKAGWISEVSDRGEVLIRGYTSNRKSIDLGDDRSIGGSSASAILIDAKGNGVSTFGRSGFLVAPDSSWINHKFRAIGITPRGITGILDEVHPFPRPVDSDNELPLKYLHRTRFRMLDRSGADIPLPSADIEGGTLVPSPGNESNRFRIEQSAIGADGSGAILRRVSRSSTYQLSMIAPDGVTSASTPFEVGLSALGENPSLTEPEDRSVTLVGRSADNRGRIVVTRFRAFDHFRRSR